MVQAGGASSLRPVVDVAESPHVHYDSELGVDWVPVDTEPHHIEMFRNRAVRIYEATIAPGGETEYHRHARDTLYVVTAGGRLRSDEPGNQRPGTEPGHSVTLCRRLSWLARRTVGRGTIHVPTGTLLMQPHTTRPLIHRVVADSANPIAVRMVGVELHETSTPAELPKGRGLRLEHANHQARTYRLDLAPGASSPRLAVPHGAVLVVAEGDAGVSQRPRAPVCAGSARWLNPGELAITSIGHKALVALIISL